MRISLLHTGQVHVATFETLFRELDFEGEITHRVESELLDDARALGLAAVSSRTHAILRELSAADAVLCTCSTIGPLVEDLTAKYSHILRIDRPAMEEACRYGSTPLVVICLESTRKPTQALLERVAEDIGIYVAPKVVMCTSAWPYFEAGDMQNFSNEIASSVIAAIEADQKATCVLLAQASMHVAAGKLSAVNIPVVTTPQPAVRAAIDAARLGQN